MNYLPRFTTRIIAINADPWTSLGNDGIAFKRIYVIPETDLCASLAPFDVMGAGLNYWSAYVDSLTAQNIRVRNVVTVINDTEFIFGLSRCLSRTELDILRNRHPAFYKEHQ